MTRQDDLFAPEHAEPQCPGFDVCPVKMCGCLWLHQGSPWRDSDSSEERAPPMQRHLRMRRAVEVFNQPAAQGFVINADQISGECNRV